MYLFSEIQTSLIDSLNISYVHSGAKKDLLSSLEKLTTIDYHNGASSYNCKYKHYNIIIGDTRIKLKGSIAKQHFGNNFNTTTRPEFIETIGELSHHLNIDVSEFKLNRVDLANNFITESLWRVISKLIGLVGQKLPMPRYVLYFLPS